MLSDNYEYMLAFPPEREGFFYKLYQHRWTKLYQWINSEDFVRLFPFYQVFPPLDPAARRKANYPSRGLYPGATLYPNGIWAPGVLYPGADTTSYYYPSDDLYLQD